MDEMDTGKPLSGDSVLFRLLRTILDLSDEQRQILLKRIEEMWFSSETAPERDHTRKPYSNTIYFSAQGRSFTGMSQDISSGGMFIKTDQEFSVGQIIIVTIPSPNGTKQARVPAEIVRVVPHGIGVEFIKKVRERSG